MVYRDPAAGSDQSEADCKGTPSVLSIAIWVPEKPRQGLPPPAVTLARVLRVGRPLDFQRGLEGA